MADIAATEPSQRACFLHNIILNTKRFVYAQVSTRGRHERPIKTWYVASPKADTDTGHEQLNHALARRHGAGGMVGLLYCDERMAWGLRAVSTNAQTHQTSLAGWLIRDLEPGGGGARSLQTAPSRFIESLSFCTSTATGRRKPSCCNQSDSHLSVIALIS